MKLQKLNNKIRNCNKCIFDNKNDVRYCGGIGKDHRVMFICESPSISGGVGIYNSDGNFDSTNADELFNKYRKKHNLKKGYTTDFVKCGSPNKKPTDERIRNCVKILKEEIKIINPKVIVGVGQIAYNLLKEHIRTKIPIIFINHYSYMSRWCINKSDKLKEWDNQFKKILEYLK